MKMEAPCCVELSVEKHNDVWKFDVSEDSTFTFRVE
jgi:hypothetical protein